MKAFLALVASFAEGFGFLASCSVSSCFGSGVEVRVGNFTTAGRITGAKSSFFGRVDGGSAGDIDDESAAGLRDGDMDLRALRRAALDVGEEETDKAEDIIFGRQIGLGSGLSTFKVLGGGVPGWQIVISSKVLEFQ